MTAKGPHLRTAGFARNSWRGVTSSDSGVVWFGFKGVPFENSCNGKSSIEGGATGGNGRGCGEAKWDYSGGGERGFGGGFGAKMGGLGGGLGRFTRGGWGCGGGRAGSMRSVIFFGAGEMESIWGGCGTGKVGGVGGPEAITKAQAGGRF